MKLLSASTFILIVAVMILPSCKARPSETNSFLQGEADKNHQSEGYSLYLKILSRIDNLPSSVPGFLELDFIQPVLENAIYMTDSGSVQTGNFSAPRIISFTNDAKFLMSFVGTPIFDELYGVENLSEVPSPDGQATIEIITFDESNDRYIFSEIAFREGRGVYTELTDRDDRCQSCHSGAPIWDPYDFWPGATPKGNYCKSAEEERYFEEFNKAKSRDPSYKLLPDVACGHKNLILADNLRILHHFGWAARRMLEIKNAPKIKYAVLNALLQCPDDLETLLQNPSCEANLNPKGWDYGNVASDMDREFRSMDQDIQRLVVESSGHFPQKISTDLRFILEQQGFSFAGIFMSTQSQYFISALLSRYVALARELIQNDPELSRLAILKAETDSATGLIGPLDVDLYRNFRSDPTVKLDIQPLSRVEFVPSLSSRISNSSAPSGNFPEVTKACQIIQKSIESSLCGDARSHYDLNRFQSWVEKASIR